MPSPSALYDRPALLAEVRRQFRIDWNGLHGAAHWARVRHHGLRIGRERGADLLVIELFAFLHDSQRVDENSDRDHGRRAAEYIRSLNGRFFNLSPRQMDHICYAAQHHSGGHVHHDATIQSCWDADRLDLARVGINPARRYLSTWAWPHMDRAVAWSLR